jgi:hypothetical protein
MRPCRHYGCRQTNGGYDGEHTHLCWAHAKVKLGLLDLTEPQRARVRSGPTSKYAELLPRMDLGPRRSARGAA